MARELLGDATKKVPNLIATAGFDTVYVPDDHVSVHTADAFVLQKAKKQMARAKEISLKGYIPSYLRGPRRQ